MTMHLVERNFGTAPNPLHWCVYRISLDTYSAKFWGSSGVGEAFVLLSLVAKNYDNSLFYSTKFISKEVTPMILIQMCTLYRPRQASMTPYNLFGKSLFSHFHTDPLFRPGIISKILYYNIRIKCNTSQAFFSFILKNFGLSHPIILQYTKKRPYKTTH